MPNRPVQVVAVIGAGSIGYRHLQNLEQLGIQRLLVCDPDVEKTRRRTEHSHWKRFETVSDTLAEAPDAVVVASPTAYHEEHTEAALASRCPVFVEKPLSFRLGSTEALAQQAINYRIVTMVACNMRFHPGPAAIRRLLSDGAIGDLISYRLHTGSYLPLWRPHQDYRQSYSASEETGGAILDCIHELDLALWFAGSARLIAAKHVPARSIGLKTDGLAEILLEHETGVIGSVHLNFIERDYRRSCLCVGTTGTLEWNFHRPEVIRLDSTDKTTRYALPKPWEPNQMYIDEMRYFLDCVAAGRPTQNSISESLPSLHLALQARDSFR